MNTYYTIQVELTLEGPILTSGGEMSEPGIDAPMARDHLGRFMLPFSLVKGKVRDALCDLGIEARRISEWLGQPSHDGQFDPERGLLRFTDFVTDRQGSNCARNGSLQLLPT